MTALRHARAISDAISRSSAVFLRDVGCGMFEVSHNALALVGLLVVAALIFVFGRVDLRNNIEEHAFGWLQARQEARNPVEPSILTGLAEAAAVTRATAADPKELTRQQANVAQWISRKYRVAPEPISRLVKEAWFIGERASLEPTLILAIMAVESSFNPFAQSSVGAQGLMQVMTRVHDAKYEPFGGNHAAFDPVTNLRVGVQVLKECIARAGSLEHGLRFYVGAANLPDDGGYAGKVLAERNNLRLVASGKALPTSAPLTATTAPAPATSGTAAGPARIPAGADEAPTTAPSEAVDITEQVALRR